MLNIAVLVSGGGTNLQALLDSEARGENPNGKIKLVVASKPGVYALERAAKAGVEGVVVHERSELKESLEYAVSDKEIGIILLTEKFGREFPEIIDEVRLHHKTPLIIEIPDRHGTGRKPDFITSYVNEAIGLKL